MEGKEINLSDSDVQVIVSYLRSKVNTALVLERVHPYLKTLYDNRVAHYKDNSSSLDNISKPY
jgi:hypothetical protein